MTKYRYKVSRYGEIQQSVVSSGTIIANDDLDARKQLIKNMLDYFTPEEIAPFINWYIDVTPALKGYCRT